MLTDLTGQRRLPTHNASEIFVESKIQFLTEIGVWPIRRQMDPYNWLGNFRDDERPFAFNLLNVFLYYNEQLVDALFYGAVQGLSARIVSSATSSEEAKGKWRNFLDTVRVSYVQGENPNPTDSGLLFARKARQILGIDEGHIVEPAHALAYLSENPDSSLMLVDDFVGSGNQMIETWQRSYRLTGEHSHSFAAAARRGADIFYVPIIATKNGLTAIENRCIGSKVRPAHILDERYSLISPYSILWPDTLKPEASPFLFNASRRAGIVDEYEHGWKGFHDLALALAFHHSVPDATLPLFFWEKNGWAPLISRT